MQFFVKLWVVFRSFGFALLDLLPLDKEIRRFIDAFNSVPIFDALFHKLGGFAPPTYNPVITVGIDKIHAVSWDATLLCLPLASCNFLSSLTLRP